MNVTPTRHTAAGWCISGALALGLCLQARAQSVSSAAPVAPAAPTKSTSDVLRAVLLVTAKHGQVVLAGATASPAGRRRAIALASVKGVTEVDANALVVDAACRPDAGLRSEFPSDLEISRTIQDLSAYWPALQASNLTTSVAAGIVTLRGTVPTSADGRAVESLARSAVGVVDVRSELRGPWWRAPVELPSPIPPRRSRSGR